MLRTFVRAELHDTSTEYTEELTQHSPQLRAESRSKHGSLHQLHRGCMPSNLLLHMNRQTKTTVTVKIPE